MGHVHLLPTFANVGKPQAHWHTGPQAQVPSAAKTAIYAIRNTIRTFTGTLQARPTLHDPRAERWPCCCASAARYDHHASHATPRAHTPTHDPSIAQLVERWTVGGWRVTRRAGIHRSLVQIRLEGGALFFDRLAFVVTSDLTAARCSQNEKESFRYRESNPGLLGESQKS